MLPKPRRKVKLTIKDRTENCDIENVSDNIENSEIESATSESESNNSTKECVTSESEVKIKFQDYLIEPRVNEKNKSKKDSTRHTEDERTKEALNTTDNMKAGTSGSTKIDKTVSNNKKFTSMKRSQPESFDTPLSNRYTPLEDLEASENLEETAQLDTPQIKKSTRRKAPAPIIIPGRANNHKGITDMMTGLIESGFHLSYTRNNINVFCDKKEDKEIVLKRFREDNTPFHTYSEAEEKTHAFVLRGLDSEPTPKEVQDELQSYSLPIKSVYRMRTSHRPLYLVVTHAEVTLKDIQTRVRILMYTRIKWERHENRKIIAQCHRCQHWGHATTNCNRQPRCVKCAGEHLTSDCTKKDRTTAAKCCNCGEDHPANYRECRVYLKKLEEAAKRNPRIKKLLEPENPATYKPAPAPAVNAWQQRQNVTLDNKNFPPLEQTPAHRLRNAREQQQKAHHREQQATQQDPGRQQRPHTDLNPPFDPQAERYAPVPVPPRSAPRMDAQPVNVSTFSELCSEIEDLNSMINLDNLLKFVKDFNSTLRACPPHNRAIESFAFIQKINSYNI